MTAYNEVVSITKRFGLKCATLSFKNIRFDTMYQAFFCTFIGVRVSYVLDIINKDLSNNDIFYNECVLVVVLFAKRFERVFQLLNDYIKIVLIVSYLAI